MQTEQLRQSRNVRLARVWVSHRYGALSLLAVLLVAVTAFHLVFLMRVPLPYVDEAWNASRSLGLIDTGRAYGTLDAGVFEHYNGYWTYFPWLATAVHVPAILLFGPTLLAMRLTSLVFGLALLILVYFIGSQLYDRTVGLVSAGLVALSYPFLVSAHLGRHDIVIAVMGFAAIALYLSDSTSFSAFSVKGLLSGLAIGLMLDVHLNGVIFGPVMLGLYFLDCGWRMVLGKRFWSFVAGATLGVAFFIGLHILPFPQTYAALGRLGGNFHAPPLLTLNPAVWLDSFVASFALLGILPSILLLLAFVFFAKNRSSSDTKLVMLFCVLLAAFSLVLGNKAVYYTIVIAPAAWMVIAACVVKLVRAGWRSSYLASAGMILAGALIVSSIFLGLKPVVTNPQEDFGPILDRIRHVVPAGSSILGPQTYWFALPHDKYLSWEQLVYYRRYAPGSSLKDAFDSLHPDYFIIDRRMQSWLVDDNTVSSLEAAGPYLPRKAMQTLLAEHSHLVDSFDTEMFGTIEIYRVDSY